MRHIFTFLILILFTLEGFAQMYISTNLRHDAIFNEETEKYELIGEAKEEITFFEFNEKLTFFKHTTPTITSAYTVKSTPEEKGDKKWAFDIVSDVGNSYYMILDLENRNIRIMYTRGDSTYLVQHSIKQVWFDE